MRVRTIEPHTSSDQTHRGRDAVYELDGLELELRLKDGIVAPEHGKSMIAGIELPSKDRPKRLEPAASAPQAEPDPAPILPLGA